MRKVTRWVWTVPTDELELQQLNLWDSMLKFMKGEDKMTLHNVFQVSFRTLAAKPTKDGVCDYGWLQIWLLAH